MEFLSHDLQTFAATCIFGFSKRTRKTARDQHLYKFQGVAVGEQNFPPKKYVFPACGLFSAKDNQGPKDSGRNFGFPPNYLKEFR